jgi:hypothetical protein
MWDVGYLDDHFFLCLGALAILIFGLSRASQWISQSSTRSRFSSNGLTANRLTHIKSTRRIVSAATYSILIALCGGLSWLGYRTITFHQTLSFPMKQIYVVAQMYSSASTTTMRLLESAVTIDVGDNVLYFTAFGRGHTTISLDAPSIRNCSSGSHTSKLQITLLTPSQFVLDFPPQPEEDAIPAICNLVPGTLTTTFTDRRVEFVYPDKSSFQHKDIAHGGFDFAKLFIALDNSDVSNVSVKGGGSFWNGNAGAYTATLEPNQRVRIDWVDETKKDERDLALLCIGVLLGILGAAALEMVKLWLPKE